MEKRIKSQTSPPQDRHKDPLPERSPRVACPELQETPTSAMEVTGKVEVAARGKRPTLQNADHRDGRTAPTKAAREGKITAEVDEEKQKLRRSQNSGRQDPGKSENIRQGSGDHNGIAKTTTLGQLTAGY